MPQSTEFVYPSLEVDRLDKLNEEMINSLSTTYWDPENPYIDPTDAPINGVRLRFDPEHEGFRVEIAQQHAQGKLFQDAGYLMTSGDFATSPMPG